MLNKLTAAAMAGLIYGGGMWFLVWKDQDYAPWIVVLGGFLFAIGMLIVSFVVERFKNRK